jgi:hypothetical protein
MSVLRIPFLFIFIKYKEEGNYISKYTQEQPLLDKTLDLFFLNYLV